MREPFKLIAPVGTEDVSMAWTGRVKTKPWDYQVTAAIPHLNTLESLQVCIDILRLQTLRPYIMVIDTGSPPNVRDQLEAMRADDCEIHFIAAHGYRHSSEPVTVALDLAQSLCRSTICFHTHTDCFLRRRDFLENYARVCNANTPAIGYRMSPRDWATTEWQWMVGHTALLLYMPSIHRAGATWTMQRMHYGYAYPWYQCGGWPDTETGFNHCLRDAGIKPIFIGHDRNHERQIDDNIDHARSYPGSKLYMQEHPDYHARAAGWMRDALREARERVEGWRAGKIDGFVNSPTGSISPQNHIYYSP